MGGVYGDMLLFFPEQRRSVTVYQMEPKINGGWTVTANSNLTISCIFQNTAGGQLKDSNGNQAKGYGQELWTETAGLEGYFTTISSIVYRLKAVNNWSHEGGFNRYSLEKVVGNNGTESDNTTWNFGANTFS